MSQDREELVLSTVSLLKRFSRLLLFGEIQKQNCTADEDAVGRYGIDRHPSKSIVDNDWGGTAATSRKHFSKRRTRRLSVATSLQNVDHRATFDQLERFRKQH
jgi:hypothetical protein